MDCKKINEYMMAFMDNTLSDKNLDILNEHLDNCVSCKQDFMVYKEIMQEFNSMELISAPEDFENLVMEKVRKLPEVFNTSQRMDNLLCTLLGLFSILFGSGLLMVLNREKILESLSSNSLFVGYLTILEPISKKVDIFVVNFMANITSFSNLAVEYLSSSRYVVLLVLLVLGIAQFFIYRKSKVEA